MRKLLLILCVWAPVLLSISIYAQQPKSGKKRITSIDDLPRHTYQVVGTVTELVTSKDVFEPFAARVRADMQKDLETYEIPDKTTLRDFYRIFVTLDMLDGNYDDALAGIDRMRELEDKIARRLMTGLIDKSIIQARRDAGEENDAAYKEGFSQYLYQAVERLPWEVVQESVEEAKGRMEMYSENFLFGVVQSQFEPAVEHTHQMGNDVAAQVIRMRYLIQMQLPLKEEIVEVYESYITANRVKKTDIWKDRNVELLETQGLHPVVVAIWDTGIDTEVFPDQLFVNTKEQLDGKDNDGNGFVDDVHGIAYTLENEKTSELLYHIEDAEKRLPGMKQMMKGFLDLRGAIDSPEATALKEKMAEMRPEEVKIFLENLMQFVLYIHGTHVAGIAVEGNPAARILTARITGDYRRIPLPPTIDRAHRNARMYGEVVAYFKANGVRVVNMSWDETLRHTESALEANGIGKDAAERAKLAREIFNIEKRALYDAIQAAPEILFVNSAGNENDDVSFEDYYPTAFDLPNVLAVGAVDQAGDETSFTSFGERVAVYANGFEVASFLPGGDRMSGSGTSASSPNAANLAGKLLAVDPSLATDDVVTLIKDGADLSEDGRLLLINPRRSVELLRSFRKN